MCGSKKFPSGQAPEPNFCTLRSHLVSTSQVLSQRACPYSWEMAKDTTQRQLRVSYNHVWFVSIVLKIILPVILVVFSLNHGVLATESVWKVGPSWKKLGPLNAHPPEKILHLRP